MLEVKLKISEDLCYRNKSFGKSTEVEKIIRRNFIVSYELKKAI